MPQLRHVIPAKSSSRNISSLWVSRLRAVAQAVGVPAKRITDIIRQRRDVSADTAIRLGGFFDVDPRFRAKSAGGLRPFVDREQT